MSPPGTLISIVIPVFNEEAHLLRCVEQLHKTFSAAGNPYELIIVNDGSSDRTQKVAEQLVLAQPDRTRLLAHSSNQGLGASLRTGFAACRGTFLTCCPADFLMKPEDWKPFSDALGTADAIVGCRRARVGYNPLMRFNAWVYPWLVRWMFNLPLRDVNWISVYKGEQIRKIQITQEGIPMLTEILVKLRDQGATFAEVDCTMQSKVGRIPSASRLSVMWRTLSGLIQLRLTYRK